MPSSWRTRTSLGWCGTSSRPRGVGGGCALTREPEETEERVIPEAEEIEDRLRRDYEFIVETVPRGARVLDLGCGEGTLLKMLVDRRAVRGTGIEIVEKRVYEAVEKGLTVHHGDFYEGLSYYPDQSFDYVILSQTLQQAHDTVAVLTEALRAGQFVVASFPNFAHWRARLQLLLHGRAPVTRTLPYQWYDTPNVHSLSIRDFRIFAREQGIRIVRHFYLNKRGRVRFWPNLRAGYGVFVLERAPLS
ncbi:MAG: methionine biosynthesis protein MetW [Thermoleophilia bacterium]|nr:methionine biosynthesis protein MetW [Thermoleophilia bacterium]